MSTTPGSVVTNSNNVSMQRRMLYMAVGTICKDTGFQGASKMCLETLTEIVQAYINELTRSCRKFCEHGHRTTPDLTDVKMALAEVGLSAHGLNLYKQRVKSQVQRAPNLSKPPVEHKTLKSGLPNVDQPSYIPNYLPGYPDMQSFVRTPTLREPIQQYDVVRERIATQRKATENSLVKFLSKTNPADVFIFEDIDADKFPCASIVTEPTSYLKALNYKVDIASSVDDSLDEKSDDEGNSTENDAFSSSPSKMTEDEVDVKPPPTSTSTINTNASNPYSKPAKRIRYKK